MNTVGTSVGESTFVLPSVVKEGGRGSLRDGVFRDS